MRILITGSRGLVGSNLYDVLKDKYELYGVDRIHNEKYVQSCFDLIDYEKVQEVFTSYNPDIVIHLAANIAVGESEVNPNKYYVDNLSVTINILRAMVEFNCNKLIFASTAAVYESSDKPLTEQDVCNPSSVYGHTKLLSEQIIKKYSEIYGWNTIIFRFFNVAGSIDKHEEQLHLIPIVLDNLIKFRPVFIFGDDYDTPDGTCIRDYIHISDLIRAIQIGIDRITNNNGKMCQIYNLGSQSGNSVKDIVEKCIRISEKNHTLAYTKRRPGDLAICLADSTKAKNELNWVAEKDINDIISDTWQAFKNKV